MKLVIQIPCHNEADHLPDTLASLPDAVEGVDEVEVLVVDDGSEDGTAEVAREHGVDHLLILPRRQGLAGAFKAGLEEALRLGADVIVNTDGDNQYEGADIPKLVVPVLEGRADIVVGDRDAGTLPHFSFLKRRLQRLGSWMMRKLSGTDVADAPSGFRAYSREAALRLNIMTTFTYTLETLIQAGKTGLVVEDVPVRTNPTERRSRLAPTMGHYLAQAGGAMVRAYALYEPLKVFTVVGVALMGVGFLLGVRFLYFFVTQGAAGNVQSLILAAILSIVGFQLLCVALLSDLLAGNRKLLEEMLYRQRKRDLGPTGRAGDPSSRDDDAGREDARGGEGTGASLATAGPAASRGRRWSRGSS